MAACTNRLRGCWSLCKHGHGRGWAMSSVHQRQNEECGLTNSARAASTILTMKRFKSERWWLPAWPSGSLVRIHLTLTIVMGGLSYVCAVSVQARYMIRTSLAMKLCRYMYNQRIVNHTTYDSRPKRALGTK